MTDTDFILAVFLATQGYWVWRSIGFEYRVKDLEEQVVILRELSGWVKGREGT